VEKDTSASELVASSTEILTTAFAVIPLSLYTLIRQTISKIVIIGMKPRDNID